MFFWSFSLSDNSGIEWVQIIMIWLSLHHHPFLKFHTNDITWDYLIKIESWHIRRSSTKSGWRSPRARTIRVTSRFAAQMVTKESSPHVDDNACHASRKGFLFAGITECKSLLTVWYSAMCAREFRNLNSPSFCLFATHASLNRVSKLLNCRYKINCDFHETQFVVVNFSIRINDGLESK
jgi:hypothetical protein